MKSPALRLVLLLCLLVPSAALAGEKPAAPELLPDLVLKVPDNPQQKKYLGLTGKNGDDFSLKDIDADILLIELFNMYCPYCQKEAPAVNELYTRTRELGEKGPVVKIIGLGVSNTPFEVDQFRKTYHVPFPLFADQDKTAFKALAGEGTPTFVGCRLKNGGSPVIVLRQAGGFSSPGQFLQELIDKGSVHRKLSR